MSFFERFPFIADTVGTLSSCPHLLASIRKSSLFQTPSLPFFLFPAPPIFRVPFTLASSQLSESLEQATVIAGVYFSKHL